MRLGLLVAGPTITPAWAGVLHPIEDTSPKVMLLLLEENTLPWDLGNLGSCLSVPRRLHP